MVGLFYFPFNMGRIERLRRVLFDIALVGILVVKDADALVDLESARENEDLEIVRHLANAMPAKGAFTDSRYRSKGKPPSFLRRHPLIRSWASDRTLDS